MRLKRLFTTALLALLAIVPAAHAIDVAPGLGGATVNVSGSGVGLGTTSGTSTTGFGKQWYPSTITGTVATGQQMQAFFLDDLNVAFLRRSTTCGNCLQVAISTDGGVSGSFVSTTTIIGNSISASHQVPSSPTRYLVANNVSDAVFQSASLASGWTAVPTITFGANFPVQGFASNADGTTTLAVIGRTAVPGLRVCRSTNGGITFPGCVDFGTNSAGGPIAFAGGTTWVVTDGAGNIWRSTNDGVTFAVAAVTGTAGTSVKCLSPTFAICLYLGVDGNVRRSTNSGLTFPTIVLSGLGANPGALCHYNADNVAAGLGVPPIGFPTISSNAFASFNAGIAWFTGQTNGSAWDGTGVPSLRSLECRNGRGIATYSTTGGGTNVFAVYNPLTQPGGVLQSSAGGYSIAAPIQAGIILNAAPTVSAANTAAVVTLTNTAGSRICIREIVLFSSAASAVVTLTVTDGAVVVANYGTPATAITPARFTGTPLLCSNTSNNLIVNIGAAGAAVTTTTSVIADRYPN